MRNNSFYIEFLAASLVKFSEAAGVNYKNQRGEWVMKRTSTPGGLFETSLRDCLRRLGFSEDQIKDVTEKPPAAEGKGKARKGGKGGRGAGGKGRW